MKNEESEYSITNIQKILLVDNEVDITFALENALENFGFKVDTFNDPITALKSYKTNFYDIVILDIKMPKMDGFQLYTKLRELDPQVKICFLTASELFYEEFRKMRLKLGEEIGEEYFIQKPIKTNDLLKKLNTIMSSL
ncbi:MAG TPA: response regulator [Nitrososphaeraceae archaeon]|nr:response regulator [Nitrososphaeraceae archaeon]